MEKKCEQCGEVFTAKRESAKYCSPQCRKQASRLYSVEDTLAEPKVQMEEPKEKREFRFKTPNVRTESGFHEKEDGSIIVRTARYWYDVPISAIPLIWEGEPEMPEFMNGRQYFLWRENDFKVEDGKCVIVNPRPAKRDKTGNIVPEKFYPGGQQSRQWGA